MKEIIHSFSNRFVKEAAALITPSGRRRLGKFILEGPAYLDTTPPSCIEYILVAESSAPALTSGLSSPLKKVSDAVFKSLCATQASQGIIAVCRPTPQDPRALLDSTLSGLCVVCENIRDPGNLGTIIRTAAAAGAFAVIVLKGCTEVYSPKAVRAAAGASFLVSICEGLAPQALPQLLTETNTRAIASRPDAETPHHKADLTGKAALLIGNEAHGLSPALTAACRNFVKIPMPGGTSSLNAAAAAAILIYESLRQRELQ